MITIHNINTDITYVSSGFFEAQNESWTHPKRVIDSFELIFVTKGTVYLKEDGAEYILRENDTIILFPGLSHGGFKTSATGTSFFWVHFLITYKDIPGLLPKTTTLNENLKMKTLFKQLLDTVNSSFYPQYAPDLIAGIILCELISQNSSLKNPGKRLTNEIAEWIRINSDKKITVKTVSERFMYNPDYLTRLFKDDFNVTIKEYICMVRVKSAKNLLISSYYSIKQISDILGWDSLNQFIKFFKYHESISPRQYRNLYVKTHLNKK